MSTNSHVAPPPEFYEVNAKREPEGERIRKELIEFLERNKIVGILLDTEKHCVQIDIAKLPPKLKSVLTKWGAITVVDDSPDVVYLEGGKDAYCATCAVVQPTYVDDGKVCCKVCQRILGELKWTPPTRPEGWDDNVVPPMTHPLASGWTQPDVAEIRIDDETATMDQHAFDELLEYSSSTPSGVYEGKMWKRRAKFATSDGMCNQEVWYLVWYGYSKIGLGHVSNNQRRIVIV